MAKNDEHDNFHHNNLCLNSTLGMKESNKCKHCIPFRKAFYEKINVLQRQKNDQLKPIRSLLHRLFLSTTSRLKTIDFVHKTIKILAHRKMVLGEKSLQLKW